ncbi:hypothetical protein [Pseudomonas phage phiPstEGF]|nr:hypothetical protein [Pseudomonas phage phiPst2111]WPH61397.1 hypothetical protein [Pseudomonas phage phiPstEGF]WPK27859.1 hypothetical protein [Pseudomonas phage phiPstE]
MEFPKTYDSGLTIVGVHSPSWTDAEKIRINCVIKVELKDASGEPVVEEWPFTACPWDTFGPHCPEIFRHLTEGGAGPVTEWVRPDVTVADLQAEFDRIWPDVALGLADQATIDLAKNLRVQIKAMS